MSPSPSKVDGANSQWLTNYATGQSPTHWCSWSQSSQCGASMANCLKLQWPPLQFCGLTCLPRMMAHDDSFNFLCPQSHNAESPRPSVQKASQPCVPCDKDPAGFAERRSTRRPPGHVSLIGAHQPSQSESALMGPCKDQPLLLDSCSDSQSTRLWSQSTRPCHEGAAARLNAHHCCSKRHHQHTLQEHQPKALVGLCHHQMARSFRSRAASSCAPGASSGR